MNINYKILSVIVYELIIMYNAVYTTPPLSLILHDSSVFQQRVIISYFWILQ